MIVVSAAEMRAIDATCGIPTLELMENAARAIVSAAENLLRGIQDAPGGLEQGGETHGAGHSRFSRRCLIVAGKGNNGGDGFAAARLLRASSRVTVYTLADESSLHGDALVNFQRAKSEGVDFIGADSASGPSGKLESAIAESDVIIDALLGTGLRSGPLDIELQNIIRLINARSKRARVLAVDIPSGLNADTGQPGYPTADANASAVRADATVTFGRPKRGLYLYPAVHFCRKIIIDAIGIPDDCFKNISGRRPDQNSIAARLPFRSPTAHKGLAKVLVVGGAAGMSGAVYLAAEGALRSGASYVFVSLPEGSNDRGDPAEAVRMPVSARSAESEGGVGKGSVLFDRRAEGEILKLSENVHAVVYGGGLSRGEIERALASRLTRLMTKPAVVDGDALRQASLADIVASAAPRVLTPHPGEFASMFGGKVPDNEASRVEVTLRAAEKCGHVVVHKGAPTIIAAPDGRYSINPTGNELLATAGTGDVLAGVIGAFLAQGLAPFDAAECGVYVHGLTTEVWEYPVGLTASDIPKLIPAAWKRILPGV